MLKLVTAVLAFALLASAANADDLPFRRTTPRGSFGRDGPDLLVGVPGGRAWGIESPLTPIPVLRSALTARLQVDDPEVREAFVRIAWYDRAEGRPRQFALSDARVVHAGESATLEIAVDPPPGAVAYRLRVLARLRDPLARSAGDALRVSFSPLFARPPTYPRTRLLP